MVEKAPPAHEEFRLAPATRGLNAQLFGYAGDARAHPDRRFPGRLQLLAQSVHWMRLWRSRRMPVLLRAGAAGGAGTARSVGHVGSRQVEPAGIARARASRP